jgi:hypothetical protein
MEKLEGGKKLEPGWFKKFLMKIGFGGKGSLDEKVRQYELNQFKNLLKKDEDLRDNFVSFAKNFAGECTSEELPKVFAVVKELLGENLAKPMEVRRAFVQQATNLAGDRLETEFPAFFAKVKDLLGGSVVDAAKELASHCTRENFSKVFTGLKGLPDTSSGCTWSGGVREVLVQRATHLAGKCTSAEFPTFFARVKDLLGENEVDAAKELASHCTRENFSRVFTKLKGLLDESSLAWREAQKAFVDRAKALVKNICVALESEAGYKNKEDFSCFMAESVRFLLEMKDVLGGESSPAWQGVCEALTNEVKNVVIRVKATLKSRVNSGDMGNVQRCMVETLEFLREMREVLGGQNSLAWQSIVSREINTSAMHFAWHCTRENFLEIFNKVIDLAGKRFLSPIRAAFGSRARLLAQECKPGDWTNGSFNGIKEALGGEDSVLWKSVETA